MERLLERPMYWNLGRRAEKGLRGSGGLQSTSGSTAKPGRGSGGRSPPEAEAILKIQCKISL